MECLDVQNARVGSWCQGVEGAGRVLPSPHGPLGVFDACGGPAAGPRYMLLLWRYEGARVPDGRSLTRRRGGGRRERTLAPFLLQLFPSMTRCFIDFAAGDTKAYEEATARYSDLRQWLTSNGASYGLDQDLAALDDVGQETLTDVYEGATKVSFNPLLPRASSDAFTDRSASRRLLSARQRLLPSRDCTSTSPPLSASPRLPEIFSTSSRTRESSLASARRTLLSGTAARKCIVSRRRSVFRAGT